MVLSNKKLKQRLRAALTESLVASEEKRKDDNHSDSRALSTSLKSLLDSATLKPRLSKREKRRKSLPVGPKTVTENVKLVTETVNIEPESVAEKKKVKKRKREQKSEGEVPESVENDGAKAAKKMKKKKKKKKKGKRGEPKKVVEVTANGGSEENGVTEITKTSDSQENGDLKSAPDSISDHGAFVTKVYVGGIPYYSTEDDVRSFFDSCGTIVEVDCMMFPDSGKFRGIAIIGFKTEAAAKRALALDGADMGGLFLKVQPYKSTKTKILKVSDFAPKIIDGYNKIYVGNLSWDITEDELRKLFSDCSISSIKFGEDKETGEFRGYAHVNFADSLSVTIALKLDQKIVCGRPVRITCAVPRRVPEKDPNSMQAIGDKAPPPVADVAAAHVVDMASAPVVDEASAVSGKIRRRTCYECGEKGHLSSACPKLDQKIVCERPVGITSAVPRGVPEKYPNYMQAIDDKAPHPVADVASDVSGKIRRRTCYECGEKGHLSSACPKLDQSAVPRGVPGKYPNSMQAIDYKAPPHVAYVAAPDAEVATAVSGKIRRRTCYECGEKGHLSSACPKLDQSAVPEKYPNSMQGIDNKAPPPVAYVAAPIAEVAAPVAEVATAVVSGKIRRRSCYECGEKGHLSSACPKKLAEDQINSAAAS